MTLFKTLKKRKEFLEASSDSVRTSSVIVQCNFKINDLAFGFTASRKVGNAVKRNRAKRRLKAVTRDIVKSNVLTNHHWVFIARSVCVNIPFILLKKDIIYAVNKCLEKKIKRNIVKIRDSSS